MGVSCHGATALASRSRVAVVTTFLGKMHPSEKVEHGLKLETGRKCAAVLWNTRSVCHACLNGIILSC